MKEESLKEKTAKGLFWGGMNNGVQQLLGLAFGILLGRLLSPSDYGMIAMIAVFSLIASELQNSGFRVALVNLKQPTAEDYNSVFWFNILVGTGLYVLLFLAAPLIARYYHEPALVPLSRYAFLGFVFASFGTSQAAYLFKNLRAKQMAKAGMTAVLVSSCVGVVMAWRGCSYWSLATQTNLFVLINTLLFWHYSEWRPTLHIDFGPVRRMFGFSVKILISNILIHVNANVLNILLVRYYSARDTGYYNQAYQWNFKCVSLIQGMVKQVDQPVLSGLADDAARQLRVLRKMVRFTAFIAFPALLGFGLVAHEFIVLAITAKWAASAQFLQLLCLAGALMPLNTLLSDAIVAKGRSDIFMWSTLAYAVLQVGLMIGLYPYGIRTMVVAYVVLTAGWFFVWHFFVRRLTGYALPMVLRDTVPFALAAAAVMAAVHFLTRSLEPLWLLLLVRVVLAAVLYYLVMRIARVKILDDCTRFLLSRFNPNKQS